MPRVKHTLCVMVQLLLAPSHARFYVGAGAFAPKPRPCPHMWHETLVEELSTQQIGAKRWTGGNCPQTSAVPHMWHETLVEELSTQQTGAFDGFQNTPKCDSGQCSPRTPLGELTTFPRPPSWLGGNTSRHTHSV